MSTIRATKAYQMQSKSDVSSRDMHPLQQSEQAHDTATLHYSLEQAAERHLENKRAFEEKIENNNHHPRSTLEQAGGHSTKTKNVPSQHKNEISFHKDKGDDISVQHEKDDEENDVKKETAPPTQGIGMGINSGIPVMRKEDTEGLSDLLSAAMSSLGSFASSTASAETASPSLATLSEEVSAVSTEDASASFLTRDTASSTEEGGPAVITTAVTNQSIPGFKSEGSVGASVALKEGLPKPIAAAVRTARFTDFLTELAATVSQARLNSANGQDISLQLRSDVLAGTNVHITANATHMDVAFSTVNAASNALLNLHLATLQNHLVALCPGQMVEVRNQFLASSSSSHFDHEQEGSQDDLASFNQGNRGSLRDHDDTL